MQEITRRQFSLGALALPLMVFPKFTMASPAEVFTGELVAKVSAKFFDGDSINLIFLKLPHHKDGSNYLTINSKSIHTIRFLVEFGETMKYDASNVKSSIMCKGFDKYGMSVYENSVDDKTWHEIEPNTYIEYTIVDGVPIIV